MANSTQTRTIIVKVESKDAGNVKKLSDELKKMNGNLKQMKGYVMDLKSAFIGLFGLFGAREIMRASDEFQLMRDRLRAFTTSAEDTENLFNKLVLAARATKTSVGAVGETFNRVAAATKDLGINNDALLGITIALQQSFRASGSTIAEATNATIQFAQGLASGQLRGQELRSVLEQNVVFGEMLSKTLGVTRGELYKIAEAGRLTNAQVLKVLVENFDELNRRANLLTDTFDQGITRAIDAFKLKIKQLNDEFGASSKFSKGIDFITKNMDELFAIIFSFVASGIMTKLTQQFIVFAVEVQAAWTAGGAGGVIGMLNTAKVATMAFYAVSAYTLFRLTTDYDVFTRQLKLWTLETGKFFSNVSDYILGFMVTLSKLGGPLNKSMTTVLATAQALSKVQAGKQAEQISILTKEIEELQSKKPGAGEGPDKLLKEVGKALEDLQRKGIKNVVAKEGPFGKLNELFRAGKVEIFDYIKAQNQIRSSELAKKFDAGKISADEYYKALVKIPDAIDTVRNKTQVGSGIQAGLTQYFESIDSLAGNVSNAVVNTFNNLENAMADFVKTGKFNFADFTQAILDDLTRIIIRMSIIRPLVGGLLGAAGTGGADLTAGGGGGGYGAYAANGGVWQNGVQKFANGGVVTGPTNFGIQGGVGLMGEAGPEAIMPLTRGPDGKLGVQSQGGGVVVQINNYSGAQTSTEESTGPNGERMIRVMVHEAVNEGLASGKYDRGLSQNFGVTRKGR